MTVTEFVVIEDLSKTFDESFQVIAPLNITIPAGTITAIMGPSGSGKTVFLWLLASLLPPTTGTISISGVIVSQPDPSRLMIFQDAALFPWFDVIHNVTAALESQPLTFVQKQTRAREALKLVGLDEYLDWPTYKLSVGMRQRVALARAIALRSQVWLLDEPFAALDYVNREKISDLLIKLQRATNATVFLVSHGVTEAIRLSHRVVVFSARPARIKDIYQTSGFDDAAAPAFQKLRLTIRQSIREEFTNDRTQLIEEYVSRHLTEREVA